MHYIFCTICWFLVSTRPCYHPHLSKTTSGPIREIQQSISYLYHNRWKLVHMTKELIMRSCLQNRSWMVMAMSISTGGGGCRGEGDFSASTATRANLWLLGCEENPRLKHRWFLWVSKLPDCQDITRHRTEIGWNHKSYWFKIDFPLDDHFHCDFCFPSSYSYGLRGEPICWTCYPCSGNGKKHPSHVRRTAVAVRKHWCDRVTFPIAS